MRSLLLLALLLLPLSALGAESAPVPTSHASATLVSAEDSVAPGKALRLALRLQLPPGWHTYWLNPGDAGTPPSLTLTGAKAGPLGFPVPQRTEESGLVSYALTGDVWLPFTATPAGAGPAALRAQADYLVCSTICVPQTASLALDLPAGSGAPGPDAPRVEAAFAAVPRASPFAATIAPDGALRIEAPGLAPAQARFIPEQPGLIDALAPQTLTQSPSGPTLALKPLGRIAGPLPGLLLLTDRTGETTALRLDPAFAPGGPPAPATPGLWRALGLAFLGGLVLNLMPCVLPVLAMKALSLARLGGAARGRVRAEAGLYVAGVLAAFAAIGAATLALAAAGHAVGWGAQFQSTLFTALTAWLMLAIGLNLAGLFEIGAGFAGIGQGLADRGSFFTGLLAVAVATPCTGPFMAAALAAALALPPAAGFAIFLLLGAGLAAPYALLALAPGLARFLPRPGRWMLTLRRALSLPMFGAALFFFWVIFAKAGPAALALALLGGLVVGVAGWELGRRQAGAGRFAGGASAAGLAVIVATIGWLGVGQASGGTSRIALAGAEPFSPARLAALRAAHAPVLVDMSAAWCITCLVNERVALAPASVRSALAKHHVTVLQGDWTQGDAAITDFLHRYGRSGVPLYVYFPPGGAPEVLPQILTESEILGRLGA